MKPTSDKPEIQDDQLILTLTDDNSYSLLRKDIGETYHSKNGAYTESMLVFINNGLVPLLAQYDPLIVLEIGFGTGLNALLSHAVASQQLIIYDAIEAFPVPIAMIEKMEYHRLPKLADFAAFFQQMHHIQWEESVGLNDFFRLTKFKIDFLQFNFPPNHYHLVYFDAFSMEVQSELWTVDLLKKVYDSLKKGGVLVTYSARGPVKRALREVGFKVERLAGPPGKRHVLRAKKE